MINLPNPAIQLTETSNMEMFKISVATVTLIAPLRFSVIWLFLIIGWILTHILGSGTNGQSITLRFLLRFGARLILFIAGFYWIPVKGEWDPRARIFVSTHHSIWDSLLFIYEVGASHAAKAELFRVPILGDYLRALDCFPVDRHSNKGRRDAISAIKQRASDPQYPPLVVFPTATCTNCRQLIEFKRGAFEAGVPVQPVGIAYLGRSYDMKLSKWVLWDMYRSVCQVVNFAAITVLPLRYPSEEERRQPILWSENVRVEMARDLGMLLAPYSLETEILRTKCRDHKIYFNETKLGNRKFGHVNIDRILEKFVDIDKDKDGFLSRRDFCDSGIGVNMSEWNEILKEFKLKANPQRVASKEATIDTWTESGAIGFITGGRPQLHSRPQDRDPQDMIEFVEVLVHVSKGEAGNTSPNHILTSLFMLP